MLRQSILVVGSLNMDQVVQVARLPVMGETLLGASSLRLVPGGKGANQAAAIARLLQYPQTLQYPQADRKLRGNPMQPLAPGGAGYSLREAWNRSSDFVSRVSVSMAGRVGRDPFGTSLLQALQADRVDTSLVVVDEQEASGVAFIFLSPTGENAIVVASGANMRVGEDTDQVQQIMAALPEARALVLQMEIPLGTVKNLVAAGHQAGVPVFLNLAPAQALQLETLRQLDTLIVNETEASFLRDALASSQKPGPVIQSLPEATLLASDLQSRGIAKVVITLGAQGAILAEAGNTIHIAAPAVQVVDTTAAGDCFAGAFTVALSEGRSSEEALRFAVYAGALKVTKFGAQSGLPTRAEVEALLQR